MASFPDAALSGFEVDGPYRGQDLAWPFFSASTCKGDDGYDDWPLVAFAPSIELQRNRVLPRYSIFFAPLQGNPLNDVAAKWLGRDAFTGKAVERPSPVDGMDLATFDSLTNSARRYGFHGTLKAPFELAQGRSIDELDEAIADYCKSLQPFVLPRFKIGQLGRFFALLPSEPSEALKSLATALVCDFDDFRAPLSEADIARRNPDKLSPSQRDNLLNWGYPHIFDNFRFHMTLSDPVPDQWTEPFRAGLEAHFGDSLNEPQIVSSLTVFEEPERGAPFTIHRQFPIS